MFFHLFYNNLVNSNIFEIISINLVDNLVANKQKRTKSANSIKFTNVIYNINRSNLINQNKNIFNTKFLEIKQHLNKIVNIDLTTS